MCTHLNRTGATYYFRRKVPDDLLGYFTTDTGRPRAEWKLSLGTKDRENAKRLLRVHVTETDKLIDDARRALLGKPATATFSDVEQEWQPKPQQTVCERLTVADGLGHAGPSFERLAGNVPSRGNPSLTLSELYEQYASSGAANAKTVRKWRSRVANLIDYLGHEDVKRITRADLNGWTAALVAKGLSKKTIVDGYLPAARAAFSIAYDDGAIHANPVTGLKVRAPKAVKLREREHSDQEAATILKAALGAQPERLSEHHSRARRWVPWLCAYTGARVGELTQLRAMDIQQEGGIWFLHLTPEAGSIKTNEARKVPLHSHLIEQGFTDLARAGDATPLFHREGAGNEINPASKVRAADLAKWIKALGVETPQPNHGWRHRFKTMCRVAEVPEHLMDALQGHAPRHEGGKYGSNPLATLRDAVERLPRYKL